MLTRRSITFAAVLAIGGGNALAVRPAFAEDASARVFVGAIYDAYKGKDAKGIPLSRDADIKRYFEPTLAALIVKDRKTAARRNDVPTLDGDPFIDAQDWDIADVSIAIADQAPGKARATASFKNAGTAQTVVLDLVKTGSSWRIADITWQRDGKPETLRRMFRHY